MWQGHRQANRGAGIPSPHLFLDSTLNIVLGPRVPTGEHKAVSGPVQAQPSPTWGHPAEYPGGKIRTCNWKLAGQAVSNCKYEF